MTPVIAFIGPSGSGKTHLITKLVAILKARGYRVGAMKHTHHDFEIDREGKDSFKMRRAGASSVLIASAQKIALIKATQEDTELEELVGKYFADVDVVLAEGFSQSQVPKILVHRKNHVSTLASWHVNTLARMKRVNVRTCERANILAIVADDPDVRESTQRVAVFAFDEVEKLADFVEEAVLRNEKLL